MITITRYRCGYCKGNLVEEEKELTCLLCARTFKIPTGEK